MSLRSRQIIKMGKADVSRGLTGPEAPTMARQSKEHEGVGGTGTQVREIGTEKEGNSCGAGFVVGGAVRPWSKKDLGPEVQWSPSHAA